MIYTRKFSENQKRALNIIWTTSGDYSYDPDFMAFQKDGTPDFYLNCIIGLVHKYYDPAQIQALFDSFDKYLLRDTFSDLLWLALENCTFEKERVSRPALEGLRRAHAQEFLDSEVDLHIAELEFRSSTVYDLHNARWRAVLGRHAPLLDPWEASLYKAITFGPELTAEQIAARMNDAVRKYFVIRITNPAGRRVLHLKMNRVMLALLKVFLPSFRKPSNRISEISSLKERYTGTGRSGTSALSELWDSNPLKNRRFIEQTFGRPMYGAAESNAADRSLCTGSHQNCRLYFTRGNTGGTSRTLQNMPSGTTGRTSQVDSVRRTNADIAAGTHSARPSGLQYERNYGYYKSHEQLYEGAARSLSAQIAACMTSVKQPLPVRTASGTLVPGAVWRALYLHDRKVCTTSSEELLSDFSVDILLDASTSRAPEQQVIACQAYAITQSLMHCGIPVQVSSFCTEREYTVLTVFKKYSERNRSKAVFDYTASGWNRDGLALRGAGYLMAGGEERKRILIVLTDASPNDGRPFAVQGAVPAAADYSGKKAVEDSADEVRQLSGQSVKVMAVLTGDTKIRPDPARSIYGRNYVRITDINTFSAAVGSLLEKQIRQLA